MSRTPAIDRVPLIFSFAVEKGNYFCGLISWVIELTNLSRRGWDEYHSWSRQLQMYNLNAGRVKEPYIIFPDCLLVLSIEFGVVNGIGNVMYGIGDSTKRRTLLEKHRLVEINTVSLSPNSLKDVYSHLWWRTICGDCCWGANSIRKFKAEDVQFFYEMERNLRLGFSPSNWHNENDQEMELPEFKKEYTGHQPLVRHTWYGL
jgi:hypothetical protein